MAFDNILNDIGGHGRYQVILLCIMILCKIYPSATSMLPVFIAAYQQHYCRRPKSLENYTNLVLGECSLSYEDYFGVNRSVTCEKWHFNRSQYLSTISSKYDLVCEKFYLNHFSTSVFFFGNAIGSTVYSAFSDRHGRLRSMYLSAASCLVSGIGAAFAPRYWIFALCRCLNGMGAGGLYTAVSTMTAECVDKEHRAFWFITMRLGGSLGIMYTGILAYYIRDAMWLQACNVVPLLLASIMFPIFIYESPRWLYTTGRLKRAQKAAHSIAKINGRKLPQDFDSNFENVELECESTGRFSDLVRSKDIRRLTFTLLLVSFVLSIGYYGVSLGVSELGGSVYVNQIISALVEIAALCVGTFAGELSELK